MNFNTIYNVNTIYRKVQIQFAMKIQLTVQSLLLSNANTVLRFTSP